MPVISETYIYLFETFYWKFYFFCSLSNMFSAIFSIVFAMGLVSVESSTVQSAFEVAIKCTNKGWEADVDALALGPVTEEEILEDACIYLRVSIAEYWFHISPVYISLSCGLFLLPSKEKQKNPADLNKVNTQKNLFNNTDKKKIHHRVICCHNINGLKTL